MIRRYTLETVAGVTAMWLAQLGEWVCHADFVIVEAENTKLRAEVERLREALESIVHPTEVAKNYIDYGIGYAHTIGELISACRKAYDEALLAVEEDLK
jgi:hypothetical protein